MLQHRIFFSVIVGHFIPLFRLEIFYQLILGFAVLFFISILPFQDLEAVQPHGQIYSNPVSMGSASQGVGMRNPVAQLYGNPAGLQQKEVSILDLSGYGSTQGTVHSSFNPGGIGGYYSWNRNWGFYASYAPIYTNFFPGSERVHWNRGHIGFAYNITEELSISIGAGPSLVQRTKSFSNWSASGNISLYYQDGPWSWGASLDVPGKVITEDYRGGDRLVETGPERLAIGIGYLTEDKLGLYGELRRTFWENSELLLNGDNVTPDWDRGIGAEWAFSLSVSTQDWFLSGLELNAGLEMGGIYSPTGQSLRSVGFGSGIGYKFHLTDESDDLRYFSIQLGVLDYSLLRSSNNRSSETIYSISVSLVSE